MRYAVGDLVAMLPGAIFARVYRVNTEGMFPYVVSFLGYNDYGHGFYRESEMCPAVMSFAGPVMVEERLNGEEVEIQGR